MRKIILDLAITLDGLIEGPNGEYDWCIMEPDMEFTSFLQEVDTIFYGRKSFELFAIQNPQTFSSDFEKEMFEIMNKKKKYVFSRSLTTIEGATIIRGNIKEEVNKLKQGNGHNIWLFGGAELVTEFINLGLIDEYQLALHPVALGSGKPLFQNLQQRLNLKLIETRKFSSGVIQLIYRPV